MRSFTLKSVQFCIPLPYQYSKKIRPASPVFEYLLNGIRKPSESRSFVLVASLHALALCAYATSRIALYAATLCARTILPRKARREPTYPRALKGVRADARVTLTQGRKVLARSAGEVQFTEKGVSGPAIFEISRAASCSGEGQTVTLDLLREHGAPEFLAFLQTRRKLAPALPCEEILTGTVHNRVGKMLLRYADIPGARPLGDVTDSELKALVRAAKGFALPVRGTEGFESAQVTAGGICTDEFDPVTMESLLVPGLYACGEVLDIDGDCGGYNLQWAWASGRAAGRACR